MVHGGQVEQWRGGEGRGEWVGVERCVGGGTGGGSRGVRRGFSLREGWASNGSDAAITV